MTLAFVLCSRKPVPSNSFIRQPVRESRPSAKSTSRPLPWRYSAIRLTAYGEVVSMGNVRRLIMILRCNQLVSADVLDTTNFQSRSRQRATNSQSSQEVWFGISSTGPGVLSTPSL